jgi:hypothetical protein
MKKSIISIFLLGLVVSGWGQLEIKEGSTTYLKVDQGTGNVGIGIGQVSPSAKLDVAGTIRFRGLVKGSYSHPVLSVDTNGNLSVVEDQQGSGADGVVKSAAFTGNATKTLTLTLSDNSDITASFTDRYQANTDNQSLSNVLGVGNDAGGQSAVNFGKIGIGTTTVHPEVNLHVDGSIMVGKDDGSGRMNLSGLETGSWFWIKVPGPEQDNLFMGFKTGTDGKPHRLELIPGHNGGLFVTNQGRVGVNNNDPAHQFHVQSAYCDGASWQPGSSREYKTNIQDLSYDQALEAFMNLNPVSFYYKQEYSDDPDNFRLGFIAEDMPELVAEPERKSLDPVKVISVLTKVVQEQQRAIEALQQQVGY